MGFNTSSIWIKIALICLALGAILFIIGFATKSWMTVDNVFGTSKYGLWSYFECHHVNLRRQYRYSCGSAKITSHFLEGRNWTAWYRATQVFECLGLICVLLALLIMLIFVFVDRMRKRSALIAIIILSFVAVIAMVIGFCIIGFKFEDRWSNADVGWSMGMAIVGAILTFVAGVMSVIDLKNHTVIIISR